MQAAITATYPVVRVSGEARRRGRTYGEMAQTQIKAGLRMYAALFQHYAGLDWARARAYARQYIPIIDVYSPACLQELHGIAEGAGLEIDDVVAMNVRTEIMYGLGDARAAECTAFAATPTATADGHLLLGQNWDWHPGAFETCVVLCAETDDGPDFLTVVEAGLLAKVGLNSAGVGVATNALVSNADEGEPGVPYHVVLRRILASSSFDEAVRAVTEARRASSANYLIAGAPNDAVDLEAAPGGSDRIFPIEPTDGVIGHADCFVAEGVTVEDAGPVDRSLGMLRQTRMLHHLAAPAGLTVEHMQAALADHVDHPQSMCRHPLDVMLPLDRSATVASVIMDLSRLDMWVADGQPCCRPYRLLHGPEQWRGAASA